MHFKHCTARSRKATGRLFRLRHLRMRPWSNMKENPKQQDSEEKQPSPAEKTIIPRHASKLSSEWNIT